MNENLDFNRSVVLAEFVANHLADLDAPVFDRGAYGQRAEFPGAQHVGGAGVSQLVVLRFFQAGEAGGGFAAFAGIQLNIGAAQQGVQAADAAYAHAWLDHPEAGRVGQALLFDAGQFDQHDDLGEIIGKPHALDDADFHVAKFDGRFPGFQPRCIVKDDFREGLFFRRAAKNQPAADQGGDQRDDPDGGNGFPPGFGICNRYVRFRGLFVVCHRLFRGVPD